MLSGVELRGTTLTVGSLDAVADELERWLAAREQGFVCLANVHVLETARRNAELAAALAQARLVLPDGAPVAWAARRLGAAGATRIAGADLVDELCRRSPAAGWRHFFLGSTAETLARLERNVRARYRGIDVCGTYSPPFGLLSRARVESECEIVNAARPDVVWVGLGAPKQERWMALAREQLDAPVLAGVGAVFEFLAGTKARAPRVVQQLGLEWAFRLAQEPRRLARRYLATNTSFVVGVSPLLVRRAAGR